MITDAILNRLTELTFSTIEELESKIDEVLLSSKIDSLVVSSPFLESTSEGASTGFNYENVPVKDTYELVIPFGKTDNGEVVALELSKKTPNAFVAGASGSGKSNLVKVICCQVMQNYTPKQVEIWYLDQKGGVESAEIEDSPHVKVATYRATESVARLEELKETIASRQAFLREQSEKLGKRFKKMTDYNRFVGEEKRLPYILCIVDELEPFKGLEPKLRKQYELGICDMLSQCRSAGVHILLATQNVTQDTLPKGTKTNIGYRVGLRTTSSQESRNIIGVSGLEEIKPEEVGKGIMRNAVNVPFNTFFIEDDEIEKIVQGGA